jgi:biotin operon repressor
MSIELPEPKRRVLDQLRAGPLSGAEIARRLGIQRDSTVRKYLRDLASDGYVEKIGGAGGGKFVAWRILDGAIAVPSASTIAMPAAVDPGPTPSSDRVALVEELLDLERAIEDMIRRRERLLEKLR